LYLFVVYKNSLQSSKQTYKNVLIKGKKFLDKKILIEYLDKLNITINDIELSKFEKFSSILCKENKKINLTSITDPKEISLKHFVDSVSIFTCFNIKKKAKIIDVGTGAGFPGIPIKILRKDILLTLLDSTQKRINFLKLVRNELELENVEFICERAEKISQNFKFRSKFDIVVSRAVAPLNVLCELCIPYVKIGGHFIAFKSKKLKNELEDSIKIISKLGGKIQKIKEIKFNEENDNTKNSLENTLVRKILIIKKIKETPKEFPRKFSKIKS
jgi:16S rRNA (guanine527-N7)-methyltransferase